MSKTPFWRTHVGKRGARGYQNEMAQKSHSLKMFANHYSVQNPFCDHNSYGYPKTPQLRIAVCDMRLCAMSSPCVLMWVQHILNTTHAHKHNSPSLNTDNHGRCSVYRIAIEPRAHFGTQLMFIHSIGKYEALNVCACGRGYRQKPVVRWLVV